MSLYDDFDVKTKATENVQGWSSGIKLLQSQLQLKKAAITQPKREQQRKASLLPVIDLKTKREEEDIYSGSTVKSKLDPVSPTTVQAASPLRHEYDWNVVDEYDPLWPNEYEKIVKELRESRDRDNEKEEKRRERRRKTRFNNPEEEPVTTPQATLPTIGSGFAGIYLFHQQYCQIKRPNSAYCASIHIIITKTNVKQNAKRKIHSNVCTR